MDVEPLSPLQLALSAISLIRHADTESYILGKSGVKSALGNIRVEFQKTNTGGIGITIAGFCTVLWNETESLRALLVDTVLLLGVLYGMLLRLLDELADDDTGIGMLMELSKSKLFRSFV